METLKEKISIFLLIALISYSRAQSCEEQIVHKGSVCDIKNKFAVYFTKTLYCLYDNDIEQLLDFCKISSCDICTNALAPCSSLINTTESDAVVKQFISSSFNGVNNNVLCIMTEGENCYRSSIQEEYFVSHYKDAAPNNELASSCCLLECVDRFNPTGTSFNGGCGSDGQYHTNLNDFCTIYCFNRTLSLEQCGTEKCGVDQGCSNTCIATFPSRAVCSNTNVVYTSAEQYCADLDAGQVSSYTTCESVDCTQDECGTNECLQSFIDEDYAYESVCTSNARLYQSVGEFCLVNINGTFADAVLCDDAECDQEACCYQSCLKETLYTTCQQRSINIITPATYCTNKCNDINIPSLACIDRTGQQHNCQPNNCSTSLCLRNAQNIPDSDAICANDGSFYSDKLSYCAAVASNTSLQIVTCGDEPCASQEQCCRQNCLNKPFESVCTADPSYPYISDQHIYCQRICADTGFVNMVRHCNGPCGYQDCQISLCNGVMVNRAYCGTDGALYPTSKDFCEAQRVNPNLTERHCSLFQPCTSVEDCCKAQCLSRNTANTYIPRCSSDFTYLETLDQYCDKFCTNPNQYTEITCTPSSLLCNQIYCCFEKCLASPYNPVCGPKFNLLSKHAYCNGICTDPELSVKNCEDGCDEDKCELERCKANPESSGCSSTLCGSSQSGDNDWVCADDNNLYKNKCEADLRGNTVAFSCRDVFQDATLGLDWCRRACAVNDRLMWRT